MPDTPPCGLPHSTWPETVCTEPAGHYRPDVDPHAGPLIIDGRHSGGCAWDEPTSPEPRMPDDTTTETTARTGVPAYDAVYAYIRRLGDHLPPDPVHRNAIIWRAVQAALDAKHAPAPGLREQIAAAVDQLRDSGGVYAIDDPERDRVADAVLAVVQPVIDELDLLRRGATERADLLEEARDALSAAGQNGAHGDDWPNIAPSIRALGERAADMATRASQQAELLGIAEHAGNTAEAARAEAARRAETAEAALARVREIDADKLDLLADWFDADDARRAEQRDFVVQSDLRQWARILRALTPPAPADQTEGEGS